ncbi:hypothetical protein APHAL10511_000070 [Amanita phalloides]|nr:hypothetical protein APHAL10511_000070 [Amanita phalloides]
MDSLAISIAGTDCISFQPSSLPNQDRYLVQDWQLPSGSWSFRAVLDGHAGPETVNFACHHLPLIVRNNLEASLTHPLPDIPSVLRRSITSFDNLIATDLLNLFPNPLSLNRFSDNELRFIINDRGRNSAAIYRCMSGSTVLLSLLDPARKHLWVASLGDSQAVLGYRAANGTLQSMLLSSFHNGQNPSEANRIREEHPGEGECILDGRILGAIAVTRAVGDFIFKLPRDYADRVFKNTEPGFNLSTRPEEFLKRNLTPPYLSNDADVVHVDLESLKASELHIIMCSDGLLDLYEDKGFDLHEIVAIWSDIVVSGKQRDAEQNLALLLLRESIGVQDLEKILAVEMDDTTILVQRL